MTSSPVTAGGPGRPWWADGVGYQVYLRSFADGDGDGVGDLAGLHARLEHLAWLGVSIVWVTPFFPSPMHDHGYDVADYTGVEPVFGDLGDVDRVVARAHELGLRVVIDLVPNHTSSEHPWFRQARSSRDNPYRDYYIWRDPAQDGGPPNNWPAHFGGDAWTFDEATGQYWLHLFLPEQPDLNWANPAVADEFDEILRFWLARGVDGFRIDVAHGLAKHVDLPDLPLREDLEHIEEVAAGGAVSRFASYDHVYDRDQPEVLDVYRRWRKVAAEYDGVLIGEVYIFDVERLRPYLAEADGLHLSFWFKPLHVGWEPAAVRRALMDGTDVAPGSIVWVQGSHDRQRSVTRFGGGDLGRARALALQTLLMGLPGVPFIYQGEELGLEDGHVPPEHAQDPIAVREGAFEHSRDGCRTPMPWEPVPGWGFTTAERPWLPHGDRSDADTVAVQRDDPRSYLSRYRELVALRRRTTLLHGPEPVQWLVDEGPVIAYRRGDAVVAANCGDVPATLSLPAGQRRVAYGTHRPVDASLSGEVPLAPNEALLLT